MRILDFADGFESNISPTAIHISASEVDVTPSGNLSSTDAQAAFLELQGDIDAIVTSTSRNISTSNSNSTVNIGTGSGTNTVNIGGANTTVNLIGTVLNETVTNLSVTDKLVTLNKGGGAASGNGTGIEVEENSSISGYTKVSSDRNGWDVKAPNTAGIASIIPGASNDEVALIAKAQTLTNKTLTSPIINTPTGIVKGDVGLGNVDNTSDVTKNAASVTLTNKTISGSSNTFTNIPAATALTGQVPIANGGTGQGTKAAGFDALSPMSASGDIIYGGTSGTGTRLPKGTDGQVLTLASGVPSWAAGGGAGGLIGDRELISNTSIEINSNGYAAYADAAASSPVDGTGGSPSSTIARNTSSPITNAADLIWTKSANNRQGEGFSIDFTVGKADQAKVLQIEFDYLIASGTFVAGTQTTDSDLTVWIYDVTNAVLIQPSTYKLYSNSSSIADHFRANFQASSNGTSYRLIVHTATTSASAYSVQFDNISIHPSKYTYGTPITDWTSFTPTGAWSTNTTYTGLWRRVGGDAEIQYKLALAGAPTSATLTLNLPSGFTIDTTRVVSTTAGASLPQSTARILSAGTGYHGAAYYNNTTSIGIYAAPNAASSTEGAVTQAVPGTFANNDYITITVSVPISGWSSSVQMSSIDDGRQFGTSIYKAIDQTGVNPNASLVKMTLDTVLFDKMGAFSAGNSRIVVNSSGLYDIDAQIVIGATNVLNNLYYLSIWKNGSEITYGSYRTVPVSSNITLTATPTLELKAGDYIEMALFGSGNNSSNTLTAVSGSTRLIVKKAPGVQTIAATETIAFRAYKAADQTGINTNASNVQLLPDTVLLDTHGRFASNSYTVPAAGVYTFGVYGELKTSNVVADQYLLKLYKGGSMFAPLGGHRAATTSINVDMSGSVTDRFAAGDVITWYIYGNGNNSGSTVSMNGGIPSSGTNGMYVWGMRIGL